MTTTESSRVSALQSTGAWWPLPAAAAVVVVYCLLYLHQGFNATDEGYLLSVGQRIAGGDLPYRDFYFLRTPLSAYIHAARIAVWGDTYTVLFSRWTWVAQQVMVMGLVWVMVRRWLRALPMLVLLVLIFAASTVIMTFPWYNYDAAFLALISVFLLSRRWTYAAGVAALLAALAKQNYLLLLPLLVVGLTLLPKTWRGSALLSKREVIRLAIGFAVPAAAYGAWLVGTDRLGGFIDNVFVYPGKASTVSWDFALAQNLPEAILKGLPLIGCLTAGALTAIRRRWQQIVLGAVFLACLAWMALGHEQFVYSIVAGGYALAGVVLLRMRQRRKPPDPEFAMLLIAGVVLQYLAGFNYAGLVLATVGSPLLLATGYVGFEQFARSRMIQAGSVVMLAGLLLVAGYHKYDYVYRDADRDELTAEFRTSKLKGIVSTERNVRQIDALVNAVNQYSQPGDYIFVFPDFPVLYYLTGRRNPTPIPWYVQLEFGGPMTARALEALRRTRPPVVFVQDVFELDYERKGMVIEYERIPRYRPFTDYISSAYEMSHRVGDVYVFLPRP